MSAFDKNKFTIEEKNIMFPSYQKRFVFDFLIKALDSKVQGKLHFRN